MPTPGINRWRGDAQSRAQVVRVTVGNPEVSDVFTLTINRKDLAVTGCSTPAEIYLLWLAKWQSTKIAEFRELTFTVDDDTTPTVLIITGEEGGRPFILTATSTGDQSLGATITVTTIRDGVPGRNVIERVSLPIGVTGGTFTLSLDGQVTGNLAYNASAATIQTALEGLSTIGVGNVSVTGSNGGPWSCEFIGTLAQTPINLLVGDGTNLTNTITGTVSNVQEGRTGTNEIYTLAWDTGELDGSFQPIPTPQGDYKFTFTNLQTDIATTITLTNPSTQSAVQAVFDAALGNGTVVVRIASDANYTGDLIAYDIEFISSLGSFNWSPSGYSNETFTHEGLELSPIPPSTVKRSWGAPGNAGSDPLLMLYPSQTGADTGANEKQRISFSSNPSAGTFTLTFKGHATGALAFNANNATVEAALEGLAGAVITDCTVTTPSFGSGYVVEFINPGNQDEPLISINASGLTGSAGIVSVGRTQTAQQPSFELQKVKFSSNVNGGTFKVTFDGQQTGAIAYNADNAAWKAALEALSNIAVGDVHTYLGTTGEYFVRFDGPTYNGVNVPQMTADGSLLSLAGSADTITLDETVLPTGPEWFDEDKNWSLARIPINGDTIVYEESGRSCLYGTNHPEINPDVIRIEATYIGQIGLPDEEGDYIEYRHRRLTLGSDAVYGTMVVEIGYGDGQASQLIRFDSGAAICALTCWKTAGSAGGDFSLEWLSSNASSIGRFYRGSIKLAIEQGIEASYGELWIGSVDQPASDVTLEIGTTVVLGPIFKNGGALRVESALPEQFVQLSGSTIFNGSGAGANLQIRGGTFEYNSAGDIGDDLVLLAGDAKLIFDKDERTKTALTPFQVYGDEADVYDANKVVTPFIVDYHETSRWTIWGTNYRLTREAIP